MKTKGKSESEVLNFAKFEMTDEEKREYIKNNCEHCPWITDFNQCVHFDYDDLKVAVEKCKGDEKNNRIKELENENGTT